MKSCFEEPNVEVIRFCMEDMLTSSGILRTAGTNPGFDESEPDMHDSDEICWDCLPPLILPCG